MIVLLVLTLWLFSLWQADMQYRRLPHSLTGPALVAVGISGVSWPTVGYAAIVAGLPYMLVGLFSTKKLVGGGDLRLAVILGGILGSLGYAMALVFFAQLLTIVWAFATREFKAIAQGPPLICAALVLAVVQFASAN